MDEPTVLSGEGLEQAVQGLDVGWAVLPGRGLVRVVPTQGFSTGFAVLARIAKLAESLDFEPELTVRREEIEISLPAYDNGGVIWRDIIAAGRIDDLLR